MLLGLESAVESENELAGISDISFEPPHVSVILPVLTNILTGDDHAEHDTIGVPSENIETAKTIDLSEVIEKQFVEYQYAAEKCEFDPLQRVLVICDNSYNAGYFSTMLYKNKVKHRLLRSDEYGYTLNRRIADMFWDYHGDVIDKDAFFDRCFVRVGGDENEFSDFYDGLYKLCGVGSEGQATTGGLKVSRLVDALNDSPHLISESMLNMNDAGCAVTVATLESLSPDDEYDEVMILECGDALTMYTAIEDLFGSSPMIIRKETPSGWLFSKSALGRPCRVSMDNYKGEKGRHCLNVELGLWGDVDGKSFLTEQTGDAIRLQLYIAEKINEGDELTIEKDPDTGLYRFCHNGNILGEFPSAIIREFQAIEGFPEDFIGFDGLYVRNIVTCISEKDDFSVPVRFRESRIWLGLDITGFARVLI